MNHSLPPVSPPPVLDKALARKGHYDGQFLIGMMHAGIYGLPSCTVKPGKHDDVRLFTTEAAAKYAGLTPCKVCRPDKAYDGDAANLAMFAALKRAVLAEPFRFSDVAALAAHAGLEQRRLDDLCRDHAHRTPADWLRESKLERAAERLMHGPQPVADVAAETGFADANVLENAFVDRMRMTPADYRALNPAQGFRIALPGDYRAAEVLAYQGRDPASLSERCTGQRIWKALTTAEGPVVLDLTIEPTVVLAKVHTDASLSRASAAALHAATLAILGLNGDIAAFEAAHPAFVAPRKGLRVPLLPDAFDALCWAIIGQQINLRFAATLRRQIVDLAGAPIGDMRAHPTPAALAKLDPSDLTSRQFSRQKTSYLLSAAEGVASGALDVANLIEGSAIAAENALTAQRGIGVWTARYVLMRTGFADAAPVGDSGLATALERLHGLDARPDAAHTARLMSHFAPNRALASMHLWASLTS